MKKMELVKKFVFLRLVNKLEKNVEMLMMVVGKY
jgi:hypothetical protein